MTIKIPSDVFDGLAKWMARGPWPGHLQDVLHEHLHAYCDAHDLDTFDELADHIGPHWVTTLHDVAFCDFLSRETEDGNVVDLYLKRRGWKERAISKAYMQGIRNSVMSLYEVSAIQPGESFLARDLIMGGEPVRVEERSATKSLAPWEHIAMRIVDVRGHKIIAGGVLPFENDLSAELIEEVHLLAKQVESGVEEMGEGEAIGGLALAITLKLAAPIVSETWLAGTVLNPEDAALPQMVNSDGDEIEFIELHCRFRKGTTQAKIRAILNAADDFEPLSAKTWNWVDATCRPLQTPTEGAQVEFQRLDGSLILGIVELHGKLLEAQTNSAARAEHLTARLNTLIGELVEPPLMARQTVEQAMAAHQENPRHPEPLDLPPEKEAELLQIFLDRHYRETLDQPIDMLNGETPRQAKRSKAGRTKLVKWLKHLETGTARHDQGSPLAGYDFTWMWEELGIANQRK